MDKDKALRMWKDVYRTLVHKEYTPGYKQFIMNRLNNSATSRQGSKADDWWCLWQAEENAELQKKYLRLAYEHELKHTEQNPKTSKVFLYLITAAQGTA